MEAVEALDREVIVERAEAVRVWLLGLGLSGRTTGAIQRELGAVIDNDPGSYIDGQRPLAGLTVADFIKELHSPNGGAVGRVKSVGDGVLKELRAAIPADTKAPRSRRKAAPAQVQAAEAKQSRRRRVASAQAEPAADGTAPVTEAVGPEPETAAPEVAVEAPQAEAPQAEPQDTPRRRGRPKGSKKAAQNGAEAHQEAPVPAQALVEPPAEVVADEQPVEPRRRRGRPRREAALASNVAIIDTPGLNDDATIAKGTPATNGQSDHSLSQLEQLWSSLHPHARRAIVLYASMLLAEAGYEG